MNRGAKLLNCAAVFGMLCFTSAEFKFTEASDYLNLDGNLLNDLKNIQFDENLVNKLNNAYESIHDIWNRPPHNDHGDMLDTAHGDDGMHKDLKNHHHQNHKKHTSFECDKSKKFKQCNRPKHKIEREPAVMSETDENPPSPSTCSKQSPDKNIDGAIYEKTHHTEAKHKLDEHDTARLDMAKQEIRKLNQERTNLDNEYNTQKKRLESLKVKRKLLQKEEIKRQEELEVISQEVRKMKERRDKMNLEKEMEKLAEKRRQQEDDYISALRAHQMQQKRMRENNVQHDDFKNSGDKERQKRNDMYGRNIFDEQPGNPDEDIFTQQDNRKARNSIPKNSDEINDNMAKGLKQVVNEKISTYEKSKNFERNVFNFDDSSVDKQSNGKSKFNHPKHLKLGIFKVKGYYPNEIQVKTVGHGVQIEGKQSACNCDHHRCETSEFDNYFSIPETIDTSSLYATLDEEGKLEIQGMKYSFEVEPYDRIIRVLGLGMAQSRQCQHSQEKLNDYPKVGKVYNKPRKFVIEPMIIRHVDDEL